MAAWRKHQKAPPLRRGFLLALCGLLLGAAPLYADMALAQNGATPPPPATPKSNPNTQKAPASPTTAVSAETALLLIRSTLLSLNDALQTGNYTVLRDLGAPSFRERNSAGRLFQIFARLTERGIDLSAVAILTPQLQSAPAIAPDGRLHILGYFPGDPVRIDFELVFEAVDRQWRIHGLSVSPNATPEAVSALPGAKTGAAEGTEKNAKDARKK